MKRECIMIDTHTHLMPDRLGRKIRAFFDAHINDRLAYPPGNDDVIASHITDGVTQVWNLPRTSATCHRASTPTLQNSRTA